MTSKVIALCELQLQSILQQLDAGSTHTANSACQALMHCEQLSQALSARVSGAFAEQELRGVTSELGKVIVSLQFVDELAQRVGHLMDVFTLIRRDYLVYSRLNEDKELPDTVAGIFSTQAEFALLHHLFPAFGPRKGGTDFELF